VGPAEPVHPGTEGLVAHDTLENDAADGSGNELHGTLMGDTTFGEGVAGMAMDFDGNGDYVDCGNDPVFDVA